MGTKNIPVFVYGTLKPGFGNYNHILKNNTVAEIKSYVFGTLYDLGSFPGLVEGKTKVKGYTIYIEAEKYHEVMIALDRLEGYRKNDSKYNLYNRKFIEAFTLKGEPLGKVWVYIINEDYLGSKTIIESGEWLPDATRERILTN